MLRARLGAANATYPDVANQMVKGGGSEGFSLGGRAKAKMSQDAQDAGPTLELLLRLVSSKAPSLQSRGEGVGGGVEVELLADSRRCFTGCWSMPSFNGLLFRISFLDKGAKQIWIVSIPGGL